jgi:hippurate hydrolase
MPNLDAVNAIARDALNWRREIHAHPELLFELPRTSAFVAEKLRRFGCDEVVTGIAASGVVGVIRGRQQTSGRVIGLRADMDALPVQEVGHANYRSTIPGRMHACGHDGHTAMLLGAAKYLAETRSFDGIAVLVFQPAEEGGGGGLVMIEEGLMERFGIQEVYALHNRPDLPIGHFALRDGPLLAASDRFIITVEGKGSHAASPHRSADPVLVAAHMTVALQSVVSRNVDPFEPAVLTVAKIIGGDALNVIPASAEIAGTIRTFSPQVRALMEERLRNVADLVARTYCATASIEWLPGYPVTANDPRGATLAAAAARDVGAPGGVDANCGSDMVSEDFSYMLEQRPGAFIWIGNGPSAALHNPEYDFDDDALPYGISFWVRLVELKCPFL